MATNAIEVKALRDEAKLYGIVLTPVDAGKLLRKVGDRHLCVDILLMDPPPSWLSLSKS